MSCDLECFRYLLLFALVSASAVGRILELTLGKLTYGNPISTWVFQYNRKWIFKAFMQHSNLGGTLTKRREISQYFLNAINGCSSNSWKYIYSIDKLRIES